MALQDFESLTILRITVGYLGEKEQFGWWQSSFFTQGSHAFLSPVFYRTKIVAQCHGVTKAAARIHDERIGTGNVYHLFRLPEDIEQRIHQVLHEAPMQKQIEKVTNQISTAMRFLEENSSPISKPDIGPNRVGSKQEMLDQKTILHIAGLYRYAFENQKEIFPFFSDLA